MEFKDLAKKEEKDLQQILQELRERKQEMKFKVANNQLKNIREIREVKKTIAKVLFLLNAKIKNSAKTKEVKETKAEVK